MRLKALGFFPLIALAACTKGGADASTVDPRELTPIATQVDISKISLFQGIEVVLMEHGKGIGKNQRPVRVIQDRDAMMRVHLDRHDDFQNRDLVAVLTLTTEGEEHVQDIAGYVDQNSKQKSLNTTFNFDINGEWISGDTTWSVEIHEVDEKSKFKGDESGARFPAEDAEDLEQELKASTSDSIEIILIPVRYNADGSGRLPDTGKSQRRNIKRLVQGMYPATEVTVTEGDELDWGQPISGDGQGWSQLLSRVASMRQSDRNIDPNTYYYGMFNSASSFSQFCGYQCTLGLSLLGRPQDVWSRASVGVGYTGDYAVTTLAHEVGHAHGREHSPCGLGGQASDPAYPHNGAQLGEWGHSVFEDELYPPTANVDMMSYCDPMWISDYTYDGIHTRINALSDQRRILPGHAKRYQRLLIDGDGRATIGEPLDINGAPGAQKAMAALRGRDGQDLGPVEGHFYEYSHLPGGWLLVDSDETEGLLDLIDRVELLD
jgi:hypothetical protein